MDTNTRAYNTHQNGRLVVGYRIAWDRVTPGTDDEDEPSVDHGWYGPGGWYFDADDETASDYVPLGGGTTWAGLLRDYGADHEGETEWASVREWDVCHATGSETGLRIHPQFAGDK